MKKNKLSIVLIIFILLVLIGLTLYIINKNENSAENNETVLEKTTTNELNSSYEIEEKQKYTSNLIDAQNGKTAFIELESKGELKTEEHGNYYTYVDPFNNSYDIKEIKNIVSEEGIMGKGNFATLFKVTVTYLDKNDNVSTMELAIVILQKY